MAQQTQDYLEWLIENGEDNQPPYMTSLKYELMTNGTTDGHRIAAECVGTGCPVCLAWSAVGNCLRISGDVVEDVVCAFCDSHRTKEVIDVITYRAEAEWLNQPEIKQLINAHDTIAPYTCASVRVPNWLRDLVHEQKDESRVKA